VPLNKVEYLKVMNYNPGALKKKDRRKSIYNKEKAREINERQD